MKKFVGIWVDHEKAWIASILEKKEDNKEKLQRIQSEVEGHIRLAGGSRSKTLFGPQEIASETKREERRRHQLKRYFREIINTVEHTDKILILGPGEAKRELEKEMKNFKDLSSKVVAIETADKMTENQFFARVREYFKTGSRRS